MAAEDRPHRRALLRLLPALLLSLAAWTPVQAALRCDLAYEVLPSAGGAADLGEAPAQTLAALGQDSRLAFTQQEAARLPSLLTQLPAATLPAVSPPAVTWGGWRGASNPAIHLELRAEEGGSGLEGARALAALLGWAYRQDAVLLACDPPEASPPGTLAYRLRPQPEDFFAERAQLFGFFGALIGLAGTPDLGYTRLGEDFWTIDFDGSLGPALTATTALFETLSGGSLSFTLEAAPVAAELPGNDWRSAPDGGAYRALLPGADPDTLASLRAELDAALLALAGN